jgi:hypothetical protein
MEKDLVCYSFYFVNANEVAVDCSTEETPMDVVNYVVLVSLLSGEQTQTRLSNLNVM